MADTDSTQEFASDATPSRASGDGERTFSKPEVESILQGRLKDQGKLKESLAAKEREAADASLRVVYLRDAVKRGLDIDLVDDLFDAYRAKPVDDRSAWFDKMAAAFKASTPTATPTKAPAIEPAKATVNASDKGSPSQAPRDLDTFSNPNDLTRADIERLQSIHGVEKAGQLISERAMKWLNGVRIKVV